MVSKDILSPSPDGLGFKLHLSNSDGNLILSSPFSSILLNSVSTLFTSKKAKIQSFLK